MAEIGLIASHTGQPGGKRTGQQMTHYIADGGLFAGAATDLLALGWGIQYVDRAGRFTAAPGPDGKSPGSPGSPKSPKPPALLQVFRPAPPPAGTLSFLSGQHAFHLPRRGLLILARGPKRRRIESDIR